MILLFIGVIIFVISISGGNGEASVLSPPESSFLKSVVSAATPGEVYKPASTSYQYDRPSDVGSVINKEPAILSSVPPPPVEKEPEIYVKPAPEEPVSILNRARKFAEYLDK